KNGKALQTPVEVLTDDGTDAAISGVAAGDTVVIEGQLRVTPGGAVKVLGPKDSAHAKAHAKP
ncbi:MAG: hypothetical protein ABI608_11690, partial [Rhizomicrobium sp.]